MLKNIALTLTIFLFPLFFLPLSLNIFTTPKQFLLVASVLLALIMWGLRVFTHKEITVSTSSLKTGLLLFVLSLTTTLVIYPQGRIEALFGSYGIYVLLAGWSYLISLHPQSSVRQNVLYAIMGSSLVLALHTILQLTFLYHASFLPLYMQSRAFTLTGSPLTTLIYLLIGTVLSLYLVTKETKYKKVLMISGILHAIALIALSMLLLPGQELALSILPFKASWNVALDAMKSPKSLFFGVGLSNYAIFFRSVKPLFLNSTAFWNTQVMSASTNLLEIVTTSGLVGALTFLALPVLAMKSITTHHEPTTMSLKVIFLVTGLALILTPTSLPILFLYFSVLGLLSASEPHTRSVSRLGGVITTLIALTVAGTTGYYVTKFVLAEYNMHQAAVALAGNDGKKVYDANLAAINHLPQLANYHLSYSQVNLSLAASLSQKTSLSDQDRQNISTLIGQAVNEGKNVVSLRASDSVGWQNLGSIYRNLINVADGADKFALESYAQAVQLDPGNPGLRLEYGGLLYQLGQKAKAEDANALYSQAASQFQISIQLKPDYPNAYYNLSKLLETAKDYSNAYLAMQKAVSLLGPDNPDLSRATTELDTLKNKVPKPTPSPSPSASPKASSEPKQSDLATPTPLPSPLAGGPVDIP